MVQVKEYDGSITDKQKKALIFMAKESPYNGCLIIKKILTKQIMKTFYESKILYSEYRRSIKRILGKGC